MKKTRLSRQAERDLIAVLRYSSRHFGLQHANEYMLGLRRALRQIGDNPQASPVYGLDGQVRRKTHRLHSIFYVNDPQEVLIIRILDTRRDAKRQI